MCLSLKKVVFFKQGKNVENVTNGYCTEKHRHRTFPLSQKVLLDKQYPRSLDFEWSGQMVHTSKGISPSSIEHLIRDNHLFS